MKVLLVAYSFFPAGGGSVRRVHSMVKYGLQAGFDFHIFTVKPEYYPQIYTRSEKPPVEENKITRTCAMEPPAKKFRDAVFTVQKPSFIKRAFLQFARAVYRTAVVPDQNITWLPCAVKDFKKLLRHGPFDIIFCSGPPFTAFIIGVLLKRKTGLPLVLDYRDLWNESAYFRKPFPFHLLNRMLENWVLKNADLVIFTTEEAREKMLENFPILHHSKCVVVPNGYDFSPAKSDVSQNGVFRFIHLGSLTPERDPYAFLLALKSVKKKLPHLKLKVTFKGYVHLRAIESIKKAGAEDMVELEKDEPYEQAVMKVAGAHVALIFQSQACGGETAVPGKFYDYLALRKPILVLDENGATAHLARKLGIKTVANINNVEEIEEKIQDLIKNYNEHLQSVQWNNELLAQFHRRNLFEKLFKEIEKLAH